MNKFSSKWINKLESREHWLSYWYQLKLMSNEVKPNDNLIEIGIGSGFTSNYLISKDVNVLKVDIDSEKSPDVVSDASSFIPDKQYDHLCAFEVFEHMDFKEMIKVIENLKSYIKKNIFISLPIYKKTPISIEIKFKKLWKSLTLSVPKTHIIDPHHKWELGYEMFNEKRLINVFNEQKFKLKNKHSYFRWRYFHFKKSD